MYGMRLIIFGISLMVVAVSVFIASAIYARKSKSAWELRQYKTYGRMCVEEGKLLSERPQAERKMSVTGKEAVS